MWTQWGFSLDAERDQILKALRLLLLDLPSAAVQRAFAGIDLEVAISDPILTQQVLLVQLSAALWRRFQGGVGCVDALAAFSESFGQIPWLYGLTMAGVALRWWRWNHWAKQWIERYSHHQVWLPILHNNGEATDDPFQTRCQLAW